MKSSILRAFASDATKLSVKALRKTALAALQADCDGENVIDKKVLKEQFESCLSSLVEKGKLIEEDGVYAKAAKDKSSKKRKNESEDDAGPVAKSNKSQDENEDDELRIKKVKDSAAAAAAYSSYSAASANSKMDLSKFGEQAWKDGKTVSPQVLQNWSQWYHTAKSYLSYIVNGCH